MTIKNIQIFYLNSVLFRLVLPISRIYYRPIASAQSVRIAFFKSFKKSFITVSVISTPPPPLSGRCSFGPTRAGLGFGHHDLFFGCNHYDGLGWVCRPTATATADSARVAVVCPRTRQPRTR